MSKNLIKSLMYLVNTMPNIFFAVNTMTQFMVELRNVHWAAKKHVLRYLHGTVGYDLRDVLSDEVELQKLYRYSD